MTDNFFFLNKWTLFRAIVLNKNNLKIIIVLLGTLYAGNYVRHQNVFYYYYFVIIELIYRSFNKLLVRMKYS